MIRSRTIFLTIAAAGLIAAAPAGDEFKGDSAYVWSARSLRMADIGGGDADPDDIRFALGRVCDGLTGEQMRHEWGKVPAWALSSQTLICSGYDGWAGKYGGTRQPCKMLERGLKELNHAQPGRAPDQVVAAAARLRMTVVNMLKAANAQRGCKL